jgi:hypothetical protein
LWISPTRNRGDLPTNNQHLGFTANPFREEMLRAGGWYAIAIFYLPMVGTNAGDPSIASSTGGQRASKHLCFFLMVFCDTLW